jgi:hypothetical protein
MTRKDEKKVLYLFQLPTLLKKGKDHFIATKISLSFPPTLPYCVPPFRLGLKLLCTQAGLELSILLTQLPAGWDVIQSRDDACTITPSFKFQFLNKGK